MLGAGQSKKADTKLGKEEVGTCAEPLCPERWEKTLPLELELRALESSNQAGGQKPTDQKTRASGHAASIW